MTPVVSRDKAEREPERVGWRVVRNKITCISAVSPFFFSKRQRQSTAHGDGTVVHTREYIVHRSAHGGREPSLLLLSSRGSSRMR